MNACINCGAELNHVAGRRKKKFCTESCRVKFFYKNKARIRKSAPPSKTTINDATKPNKAVKNLSEERPKTNFSIDTRPKTLDQLKALCPPELKDFDRSAWISTERQKYGI